MDITIKPGKLTGCISAMASKSQAHRLMICAAFADRATKLLCNQTNRDMEATADCLQALGATIHWDGDGYTVIPAVKIPKAATLNCCESGSTLRFLLPVAAALGVDATFQMEGRLPQRPLSPMEEELTRMGCVITRPTGNTLRCVGQLRWGDFTVDGGISSQFITGLLLGCALLPEKSRIHVTGRLESKPYVDMTVEALSMFGVCAQDLTVGGSKLRSPGNINIEGDWSNAAFFLAAKALGSDLQVTGLNGASAQGDRTIVTHLQALSDSVTIDGADIPDLIPILSVVAAAKAGAVFTNIRRLRLKESDRVASVVGLLKAFGIHADATDDTLQVYPGAFSGATVDACGDHRIAMSAAIAATVAAKPVTVLGAECVSKSYPGFWDDYKQLGGQYEQHIR